MYICIYIGRADGRTDGRQGGRTEGRTWCQPAPHRGGWASNGHTIQATAHTEKRRAATNNRSRHGKPSLLVASPSKFRELSNIYRTSLHRTKKYVSRRLFQGVVLVVPCSEWVAAGGSWQFWSSLAVDESHVVWGGLLPINSAISESLNVFICLSMYRWQNQCISQALFLSNPRNIYPYICAL